MTSVTAKVVLFALVTIACWEFIRFLGGVIVQGLKNGTIRHTTAKTTCSKEENPWSFWILVVVFSSMLMTAVLLWTALLFDIAPMIAGSQMGILWKVVGQVALGSMVGLPAALLGFDLAAEVLKSLRIGVIELDEETFIQKADEPSRYWRSIAVKTFIMVLVLLIGFAGVGSIFGWVK